MNELLEKRITAIFHNLHIESESSFVFAGQRFPVPAAANGPAISHPLPADPLVRHLQTIFYTYCYSRSFERPPLPSLPELAPMDPGFVSQLSAANKSREVWDQGWEVYLNMPDGKVFARKADRQHAALPGEFVLSGGQAAVPSAAINLLQRREAIGMQPGFYYAYGEVPNDVWDDYNLVRFYFHIESAGAPVLLDWITRTLNDYIVPFQFKTLDAPAAYDRADSAVLYLARRYYEITARLILAGNSSLKPILCFNTPLFTRVLMDGVGVADDPGNGESFGMHRCRLLAEALVEAFRAGAGTEEARLQAMQAHFALNGLDAGRPHLSPGLVDYPSLEDAHQEVA